MARKLRVQFSGAIYHVMNRGDRREPIFQDDEDRRLLLKTLGESAQKTDWQIHAWCLMGNHFHLLLETPRANLVDGMKWLLGTYTIRFNHRHKEFGHLFSGRYKALMVEGSGNGYLKAVGDYVHLNPVRAGLLRPEQPLQDYPWSSYPLYLKPAESRPAWLRVGRLLGEWGVPMDTPAGREQFALRVEIRRRAETQEDFDPPAGGWCAGSEQFRQELLAQVQALAGPKHRGQEIRESALAQAERMVKQEVVALGWTEFDLEARRKGDPRKVRIAARLRCETTMTLEWIAARLHMGAGTYVAHLLNHHQRKQANDTNCTKTLF
jgi:REP element-mobilizing transposase RayT